MNVENDASRPLLHLLIVPSGQIPSATDIRRVTSRLRLHTVWSDAAVRQLLNTAAAAECWLTEHPEEALRLFQDPAGAVEEMRRSGFVTESVDDLLNTLRELAEERRKTSESEALRARMPLHASVSFVVKPALRSSSPYKSRHRSKLAERKR